MLYSGGSESAKLDHDPRTAAVQRAAVVTLLNAALA
jgi:hypothetical protein